MDEAETPDLLGTAETEYHGSSLPGRTTASCPNCLLLRYRGSSTLTIYGEPGPPVDTSDGCSPLLCRIHSFTQAMGRTAFEIAHGTLSPGP
ncbi:hypothetical protein PG984_006204 [Apiospora sp. TS-2023a]